jgi:hypothetical protein
MGMTPEGKIKAKLDKMLKSKERLFYFPPQAGPFGSSGIPDRIVCFRGFYLGIECKADEKKPMTGLQLRAMRQIEEAGGIFFLVYDDETIAKVEEWIDACS